MTTPEEEMFIFGASLSAGINAMQDAIAGPETPYDNIEPRTVLIFEAADGRNDDDYEGEYEDGPYSVGWSPDNRIVSDDDHGRPVKRNVTDPREALREAREWLETDQITIWDASEYWASGGTSFHQKEVTLNDDGTWTPTGRERN